MNKKLSEMNSTDLKKQIDDLYLLLDEEKEDGFILHSKITILQNQFLIILLAGMTL
jgi:hypothetical protein